MPNDFTGRIWKVVQSGTTPFGTLNIKIKGGVWSGGTAAQTFIITDVAGRQYVWNFPGDADALYFQELGWLSGPLAFGGTFAGEVNLYLGTR